jgi:hypothetical protein
MDSDDSKFTSQSIGSGHCWRSRHVATMVAIPISKSYLPASARPSYQHDNLCSDDDSFQDFTPTHLSHRLYCTPLTNKVSRNRHIMLLILSVLLLPEPRNRGVLKPGQRRSLPSLRRTQMLQSDFVGKCWHFCCLR